MSLSSRITISDGTASVAVDGHATLDLGIEQAPAGGSTNLRMADGSLVRQVAWEKDRITITGSGWDLPALSGIDWSQQLIVTVPTATGTEQHVGMMEEFTRRRTLGAEINTEWSLTLLIG